MDEAEMKAWNDNMEKLIQSIHDKFPNGCKNITVSNCKYCLLDKKDNMMYNNLCEIIASQYKRQ